MTEAVSCCTCLQDSTPDIPYFNLDSDPTADELNCREKLLYCIPEFEEVLPDYEKGGWICKICCAALCWSYNFRKMCLQVKSKLEETKNNVSVGIKDEAIDIEEMCLTLKSEPLEVKPEPYSDDAKINNNLAEIERPIFTEETRNPNGIDSSLEKSSNLHFSDESNMIQIERPVFIEENHIPNGTNNSLVKRGESHLVELTKIQNGSSNVLEEDTTEKQTRKPGNAKEIVVFFPNRTKIQLGSIENQISEAEPYNGMEKSSESQFSDKGNVNNKLFGIERLIFTEETRNLNATDNSLELHLVELEKNQIESSKVLEKKTTEKKTKKCIRPRTKVDVFTNRTKLTHCIPVLSDNQNSGMEECSVSHFSDEINLNNNLIEYKELIFTEENRNANATGNFLEERIESHLVELGEIQIENSNMLKKGTAEKKTRKRGRQSINLYPNRIETTDWISGLSENQNRKTEPSSDVGNLNNSVVRIKIPIFTEQNSNPNAIDNSLEKGSESHLVELETIQSGNRNVLEKATTEKKTRKRGRQKENADILPNMTGLSTWISDLNENQNSQTENTDHYEHTKVDRLKQKAPPLSEDIMEIIKSYLIYQTERSFEDNSTFKAQSAKKPRKRGRPKKKVDSSWKHIPITDEYTQKKNYMENRKNGFIKNYCLRQNPCDGIQKELPCGKQDSENMDVERAINDE